MKPEKKTAPRRRTVSKAGKRPAEGKTIQPRAHRVARAGSGKGTQPAAEPQPKPEVKQAKPAPPSTASPASERTSKVPPLLLEGDQPSAPSSDGPGPPEHRGATELTGGLPEAYGTKKLLLTARDPHWLYAHWDLSREELRDLNRRSAHAHLVLRVYRGSVADEPFTEVHVHPESRNWFVHVGRGSTQFVAELGYYAKPDSRWVGVSVSAPTSTPPDALSSESSVRFANIPINAPFEQLLTLVRTAVSQNVPLAEAILQLRAAGYQGLPEPGEISAAHWTPMQERELAELISMEAMRRVWTGSMEISELIRRMVVPEISSGAPGALASVSSPFGGGEQSQDFWFSVNAELIIYGATEPGAKVAIGGREITLRPDGSFSFRIALPDGQYELQVVAVSSDQSDTRVAELKFTRQTRCRGEVGAHLQDAPSQAAKPPNVG